jgi:hypothetical protein
MENKSNYFGAPWMGVDADLIGRDEWDRELTKRLVPEWKLEGLNFKDLIGSAHAWCMMRVNHALRKVGIKGTGSAGARSLSKWGVKCPFWFGAALDVQHKSGGRHACFFLYWIDEKKKLCATLDGNRGNRFAVNVTDLSGKGDRLVSGPRGPANWVGQSPSMDEVIASYPFFKLGKSGSGSTR